MFTDNFFNMDSYPASFSKELAINWNLICYIYHE